MDSTISVSEAIGERVENTYRRLVKDIGISVGGITGGYVGVAGVRWEVI